MNLSESLQILFAPLRMWRESQTGDLVCEFSTQRNHYAISLHFGESAKQLSVELPKTYSDRHGWWKQWYIGKSATLMFSVAHTI